MMMETQLNPLRRTLIGHGALLIFAGGAIGFAFLFFILGELRLWPIPGVIEYQLPGSERAWRMAHLEAIINGALVWLVAAILPMLPFSVVGARRVVYGLLIVAWTFVIASTIAALFPDSRGLAASATLTNNIVFGLFYVGVALVMAIMAAIAWRSLRGEPSDKEHHG